MTMRSRLPAADVAALPLCRPERSEQAIDERDGRQRPGLEHRRPDRRPLHHVRLDGHAVCRDVPGRLDAAIAGERCGGTCRVDDPDLADLAARVAVQQRASASAAVLPARIRASPFGPWATSVKDWVDDGADARLDPRAAGADERPARLDRDAEPAGSRVAGDDRIGHRGSSRVRHVGAPTPPVIPPRHLRRRCVLRPKGPTSSVVTRSRQAPMPL